MSKTNHLNNCFKTILITILLSFLSTVTLAQIPEYEVDDFLKSVKFNDVKGVKKALDAGMSPNAMDRQGNTALTVAITEKSYDVAKYLMNLPSIDLDRRNLAGESPLMMAAFTGAYDIVVYLVDQKMVEINHPGWSALHYAATSGDLRIVQFLLQKNAYVDALSPNGTTPLMMAARFGHIHVVKALLDSGATLSIQNGVKLTAIDFAEAHNQNEIANGLRSRWLKLYGKPYKTVVK